MSTSRLEKFIYAICSMEVSDLPAPLSRIEILWNCLITGETPDFEPRSRNEQYLMAMLGLYELENLPAPMSRGEKLLYKIAVGETDLSDVPGYLSRYEELLKYLIENGGIGIFEYVLYTLNQSLSTLYQTVEKPVKSAILKGNTLVNLTSNDEIYYQKVPTDIWTDYPSAIDAKRCSICIKNIKPNTRYIVKTLSETKQFYARFYNNKSTMSNGNTGWININSIFTTLSDTNKMYISFRLSDENEDYTDISQCSNILLLEYQEGMENWDIPFFNGMQSVKLPVLTTTGKNLLSSSFQLGWINTSNGSVSSSTDKIATIDLIKVLPSTEYAITRGSGKRSIIAEFDDDENYLGYIGGDIFTTKSNTTKIRIFINATTELIGHSLTVGANNKITYEPYKSNILTVNEDVTLRSNGSVCDELDLLTGKLTQRIGEDGGILTQEVVKTVDLTTVDQDRQPTKLKTFNDITHVEIKADNLIPSVDLEVATKISETLSTLGLEHHDISETQNELGQTIEEQTENTDATMMATTEIYEQIL